MQTTQLYILQVGDYFKIGITKSIRSRIKQIQTGCPLEIRAVYYVEFDSKILALEAERKMHEFFNKRSSSGEWFVSKKGWLVDAESALRVIKNDILLYLKIYKINNNQSYYEYKSVASRIFNDKSLALEHKIDLLNTYKGDLIKNSIHPDVQMKIDNLLEKLLFKLASTKKEISEDDFKRIMHLRVRDRTNKDEVKKQSDKVYGPSYQNSNISIRTLKTIEEADDILRRCNCQKDIPVINEIEEIFPCLKNKCAKKIESINIKVQRAMSNIPSGAIL